MACNAPNIDFTVVDINAERIEAWNSENLPIFEPQLAEVVRQARDGKPGSHRPNLSFTTQAEEAIADADIIFVSVNTPNKSIGLGAGSAINLAFVEAASRQIAKVSTTNKIVVEKSTVPCRTAESIRDILYANGKPGIRFDVVSNPEFLAEGTAISDLLHPDRVLIGSLQDEAGLRAAATLVGLYARWIPRERIITMNLWSSELAKIAANALLAQRISSINSLSAICEATSAEIDEVSYAVGLDQRIGSKMLKSSVGFGGSCFKKDILSLVYLAEHLHLPEVAMYWKSVVEINEWQKDRFTKRIIHCLYNTLVDKKIAVFGFAYKKNTGDTRESAAISIVNSLVAEGARVNVYDPQVKREQMFQDLAAKRGEALTTLTAMEDCVTMCHSAIDACVGAHAVVLVTEWDEFKTDALSVQSPHAGTNATEPHHKPSVEMEWQASDSIKILDERNSTRVSRDDSSGKENSVESFEQGKRVDWRKIAGVMSRPAFVFDGRNVVEAAKLERLGFRVECIGNARSDPMRWESRKG